MSASDYHPFVPQPHETKIAGPTAREHAQTRMKSPRAQGLFAKWEEMFNEPFRGITTAGDGDSRPFRSTHPRGRRRER